MLIIVSCSVWETPDFELDSLRFNLEADYFLGVSCFSDSFFFS